MKNFRVKYALVMYFGRKSNLMSSNKFPKKILYEVRKKKMLTLELYGQN